jgi:hypothetical protein
LIDWIDMDYAPEHYSQAQLDELDRLTARWISDHARRAKQLRAFAHNSRLHIVSCRTFAWLSLS